MFDLENLMKPTDAADAKSKRAQIAALLKTNPDALRRFEESYAIAPINADSIFAINSRNVKKMQAAETDIDVSEMISRIVSELLAKTTVWSYNGDTAEYSSFPKNDIRPVTKEEIEKLPERVRPQLTGSLMHVQINEPSSVALLQNYAEYADISKSETYRRHFYHLFRQGLDILDYDPIMYAMIDTNPNSMSHWLPALIPAVQNQTFFKVPNTKIIKVPIPVLQLTRLDYGSLTPTTLKIVDDFCFKAFDLDDTKNHFIKTGTYSSKFDFRNTKVAAGKETHELGEYLLFIHHQANNMASPLNNRQIYGVSTTTEWVVREFIEDVDGNPCIYHGMPLHTEYRAFVDFDTKDVLCMHPYWDPDVMKQRFNDSEDSDTPDNIHDGIAYMAHEETLMRRYDENKNSVTEKLKEFIQDIELTGQWSIDIMQNGNDFYIIDMAIAESSAFYECVPPALRRKMPENWLPTIE